LTAGTLYGDVIVIIPGIVSVTVMKPSPGMSGAMAEGRELEMEVAEDTISDEGMSVDSLSLHVR
jgi:hypothetical protein